MQTAPRTAGFTLLEILIAMVILTVGLLGVAYMQTWTLKFGQDAFYRGQLVGMGNELIDRMRARQIQADDDAGADYTAIDKTACAPDAPSPQSDAACFAKKVSETLQYGNAEIAVNGDMYEIKVYWADPDLTDDIDTQTKCEAKGANRKWSAGLSWVFDNAPDAPICMFSHTWVVRVYDADNIDAGG